MRQINKTPENFNTIKDECQLFLDTIEDSDMRSELSVGLDFCHGWNTLINSMIFQLAIGYIEKNTDSYLIINEDY